jgi:hypothetical protein
MDRTGLVRLIIVLLVAAPISACSSSTSPEGPAPSGLPSCSADAPLTVSPVPISAIHEIAPLGSLFPPGHTTPTGHIYFHFAASGQETATPVPLVAPGDIVITEVLQQTRTGGGLPAFVDFALTFSPCADLRLFLAHVTSLDAALTARIGPLDDNCRPAYSTGGFTYQQCLTTTTVAVGAGESLGAVSGPSQGALDFGGADRRVTALAFVNPSRSPGVNDPFGANRTICPVDYFTPPVRDALRAHFGRGGERRSAPPVCGEVMQDIAGTAQGRWFHGSSVQDDMNLALVHDNVNPEIAAISVGTAVPSLPSRVYRFVPASSGRLNSDFPLVTVGGGIHCYDATDVPDTLVFLQLVAATRLQIEGRPGASCGDPSTWAFTSAATEFER